ncbi:hypothetical protein KJ855_02485 [Patescibacteria group bacterium]|nr:hypothetical protein [Patescibacteria group bacterium]
MGKKRNKKKKNKLRKAHILQATQRVNQESLASSPISTPQSPPTTSSTIHLSQARFSTPTGVREEYFTHIWPDFKFFLFVTVLMAVILAAIYFWDASSGIILYLGGKIYELLHLS